MRGIRLIEQICKPPAIENLRDQPRWLSSSFHGHIKQQLPSHQHPFSSTSNTFSRRPIENADQHEVLNCSLRGGLGQVSPASCSNTPFKTLTTVLVSPPQLLEMKKCQRARPAYRVQPSLAARSPACLDRCSALRPFPVSSLPVPLAVSRLPVLLVRPCHLDRLALPQFRKSRLIPYGDPHTALVPTT